MYCENRPLKGAQIFQIVMQGYPKKIAKHIIDVDFQTLNDLGLDHTLTFR